MKANMPTIEAGTWGNGTWGNGTWGNGTWGNGTWGNMIAPNIHNLGTRNLSKTVGTKKTLSETVRKQGEIVVRLTA